MIEEDQLRRPCLASETQSERTFRARLLTTFLRAQSRRGGSVPGGRDPHLDRGWDRPAQAVMTAQAEEDLTWERLLSMVQDVNEAPEEGA